MNLIAVEIIGIPIAGALVGTPVHLGDQTAPHGELNQRRRIP